MAERLTFGPATLAPYRGPIQRPALTSRYFAYLHAFDPLAASAVGSRDDFVVSAEADFEIMKIAVLANNYGAKIRLEATPQSESYTSVPIFLSALAGRKPLILDPGLRLRRNSVVTAILDDRQTTAASQSIFIAYHGRKVGDHPYLPPRVYHFAKPYWYVANFTANDGGSGALAANGTGAASIRTDGDSDFEVRKILCVSDAEFACQVESQGGDLWFNEFMRSELLSGSLIETPPVNVPYFAGEYPFELPAPRVIQGANYITVHVEERGSAANRIQVIFYGVRLYPAGGVGGRRSGLTVV